MDTADQESAAEFPWLASMLQTVDPLFPIGSYAHSYGLEELVAGGLVTTEKDLCRYLDSIVNLNLTQFELPYLRFAYNALESGNPMLVAEIDSEIGASKLSKEIRTASVAQGRQRLSLLLKLRPGPEFNLLEQLREEKRIAPHHITVFAAERIHHSTPEEAALASWAYQALAAPCAAALKIMRIGQDTAQRTLTRAIGQISRVIRESLRIEREWAGAFNPTIDIASDRHERAFARLFIS